MLQKKLSLLNPYQRRWQTLFDYAGSRPALELTFGQLQGWTGPRLEGLPKDEQEPCLDAISLNLPEVSVLLFFFFVEMS
jgi:hypothetical protein